jgi:hypothetical protein
VILPGTTGALRLRINAQFGINAECGIDVVVYSDTG